MRGNEMIIEGEEGDVAVVEGIFADYAALFEEGRRMSNDDLKSAFKQIAEDRTSTLHDYFVKSRLNPSGKKQVVARSAMQRRYLEAIDKYDVVFGIGPAGTGKTFLAVAKAVEALFQKRVNRIILARPAVEAGEKLGFLPGDLQDKVDPYLRPLYDALFDLVDYERVTKLLEKRVIEVAPLAFMRGRAQTLDSLLMTPTGWRRMGDIQVGDMVIGSDGKTTEVLGVYPQGKKPVYRLTMTDGSSAVACAEHLWQVKTMEDKRRDKPARILQTQEMLGNLRRNHQYRYELPLLSAPIEWEFQPTPLDPYALGLLLGDGCMSGKTSPSFATADVELVTSLNSSFSGMSLEVRRKSEIDYVLVNPLAGKGGNKFEPVRNPLTQALRELSLEGTYSSTQVTTKVYLYNSAELR